MNVRYVLCAFLAACAVPSPGRAQADSPLLVRRYREGEQIVYRMSATNRGKSGVTHYEARATGVARKDSSGAWYEEYAWSDLRVNDRRVVLGPASLKFRQRLSLSPSYRLAIPDMHGINPGLIGPVVDLLTFYADLRIALREPSLAGSGDHVYVNDGSLNSWADGSRIVTGEDAIDFDLTLADVDASDSVATLLIRHVPPARPGIALAAPWMNQPVAGTPNNWVQVERNDPGGNVASVGKETFIGSIRLSLVDGRILSATLDNNVDVMERACSDSALTHCGDPVRYSIVRRIEIEGAR